MARPLRRAETRQTSISLQDRCNSLMKQFESSLDQLDQLDHVGQKVNVFYSSIHQPQNHFVYRCKPWIRSLTLKWEPLCSPNVGKVQLFNQSKGKSWPRDVTFFSYSIMSGWWFQTCFYFPFHIWDVILPIDELIFFNMVKTTNQMFIVGITTLKLDGSTSKQLVDLSCHSSTISYIHQALTLQYTKLTKLTMEPRHCLCR